MDFFVYTYINTCNLTRIHHLTYRRPGVKTLKLIFTKTKFCQRGNTKRMAHIQSNSLSSRPIRKPLKKHQSCFKISYLWKIPHFGCIFYPDRMFCHDEKDAQKVVTGWLPRKNYQNDVTQKKIFIMTVKSFLEVQNTNNSGFGCY